MLTEVSWNCITVQYLMVKLTSGSMSYINVLRNGDSAVYSLVVQSWGKTHKTTTAMYGQFTYIFIKNEISKRPLCSLSVVAYGPVKSLCV